MPAKNDVRDVDDPFADLFFSWNVSDHGYVWDRADLVDTFQDLDNWNYQMRWQSGRTFLTKKVVDSPFRSYRPLSYPDLFQTFARTRLDKIAIQFFSNCFGMLGVGLSIKPPARLTKKECGKIKLFGFPGESEAIWRREIRDLRTSIGLWEALASHKEKDLKRCVLTREELQPSDVKFVDATPEWPILKGKWLIVHRGDGGEIIDLEPSVGSVFTINQTRREKALAYVLASINSRLKHFCAPWIFSRNDDDNITIRHRPKNLLGAIWWQFGRAVMGEASYSECKHCKKLIEHSSGDYGFRRDREFCSGSCKFKDHRAKVKRAKKMKAAGKTVKQIASALSTSPTTIENWCSKEK